MCALNRRPLVTAWPRAVAVVMDAPDNIDPRGRCPVHLVAMRLDRVTFDPGAAGEPDGEGA